VLAPYFSGPAAFATLVASVPARRDFTAEAAVECLELVGGMRWAVSKVLLERTLAAAEAALRGHLTTRHVAQEALADAALASPPLSSTKGAFDAPDDASDSGDPVRSRGTKGASGASGRRKGARGRAVVVGGAEEGAWPAEDGSERQGSGLRGRGARRRGGFEAGSEGEEQAATAEELGAQAQPRWRAREGRLNLSADELLARILPDAEVRASWGILALRVPALRGLGAVLYEPNGVAQPVIASASIATLQLQHWVVVGACSRSLAAQQAVRRNRPTSPEQPGECTAADALVWGDDAEGRRLATAVALRVRPAIATVLEEIVDALRRAVGPQPMPLRVCSR